MRRIGCWAALVLAIGFLPVDDVFSERHIPNLHALPLQIPEGYPRKLGLFQYLLVQIVELMELVWRSVLGIEEHIGRVGFR